MHSPRSFISSWQKTMPPFHQWNLWKQIPSVVSRIEGTVPTRPATGSIFEAPGNESIRFLEKQKSRRKKPTWVFLCNDLHLHPVLVVGDFKGKHHLRVSNRDPSTLAPYLSSFRSSKVE